MSLLADERAWFTQHPKDATKLLKHGESEQPAEMNEIELAAMATVCQAILNLDATILHLLRIDHERLNYKYQGRRFRLTDVHEVVQDKLLA